MIQKFCLENWEVVRFFLTSDSCYSHNLKQLLVEFRDKKNFMIFFSSRGYRSEKIENFQNSKKKFRHIISSDKNVKKHNPALKIFIDT